MAKIEKNDLIEKCDVSGPGFINIYLSKKFAQNELKKLVCAGVKSPFVGPKKKVVIDFSSPNIAKEMHVGHLRFLFCCNLGNKKITTLDYYLNRFCLF